MKTIGSRKYIKTCKPWSDSGIKVLQKTVKRLKRKLKKLGNKYPDFYKTFPKYNRVWKEYKSMLNHNVHLIKKRKEHI